MFLLLSSYVLLLLFSPMSCVCVEVPRRERERERLCHLFIRLLSSPPLPFPKTEETLVRRPTRVGPISHPTFFSPFGGSLLSFPPPPPPPPSIHTLLYSGLLLHSFHGRLLPSQLEQERERRERESRERAPCCRSWEEREERRIERPPICLSLYSTTYHSWRSFLSLSGRWSRLEDSGKKEEELFWLAMSTDRGKEEGGRGSLPELSSPPPPPATGRKSVLSPSPLLRMTPPPLPLLLAIAPSSCRRRRPNQYSACCRTNAAKFAGRSCVLKKPHSIKKNSPPFGIHFKCSATPY